MDFMMSVILAIFASTGFWAFVQTVYQRKTQKKSATARMLRGLAFDRMVYLGGKYIEAGHISKEDYTNFYTYLYEPYKALGGDGVVDKIMAELNKLKISD